MSDPKQIIVVRKDLNMRKGKMIAQGAHGSLGAVLKAMVRTDSHLSLNLNTNEALKQWINGPFKKIAVSVNSEQELLDLYKKAQDAGLLSVLITDSGLTEFSGVPTHTVVAIGPAFPEDVDPLTSHLPLL